MSFGCVPMADAPRTGLGVPSSRLAVAVAVAVALQEVARGPSWGAPEIVAAPGTCRVCPLTPEGATESVAPPHPRGRGTCTSDVT